MPRVLVAAPARSEEAATADGLRALKLTLVTLPCTRSRSGALVGGVNPSPGQHAMFLQFRAGQRMARDDPDIRETRVLQRARVVRLGDRSAMQPATTIETDRAAGIDRLAQNDVRYREPSARREDAKGFPIHRGLVGAQIDDAVGDEHIRARVRQRRVLQRSLAELDRTIVQPGLRHRFFRPFDHLRREIDAEHLAAFADLARGQDHVDTAAATEIDHRLARLQVREADRVAAAAR